MNPMTSMFEALFFPFKTKQLARNAFPPQKKHRAKTSGSFHRVFLRKGHVRLIGSGGWRRHASLFLGGIFLHMGIYCLSKPRKYDSCLVIQSDLFGMFK